MCFSVLCQMHLLAVWELLSKSVSDKDALVYSQLTLCVRTAKVNRLFAGPGAVWQLQRGPSCSPVYAAESEVCLGLTFQNQEGSSITAALSALPCHPLFPTDAVGAPNPLRGVTRSTRPDSVMGRSFSLCHIKISAKTENGRTSHMIYIHIPTEILYLPCIIQFGRDKKC